ncbi:radical SAM protein with 4Fe4S-binding SPASM domain [Labrenzia sp. EL_142]|nr:radical SAM protein with 4Fe4S-binding SPASM domain [Labrenzia sp. EL_142]
MVNVRETILKAKHNAERDGNTGGPAVWPVFGSEAVAPCGALGLGAPMEEIFGTDQAGTTQKLPHSDTQRDVFEFERSEVLPLVDGLSHHLVDCQHLWIAVEDGKLIVADDDEHGLLLALIAGKTPIVAAMELALAKQNEPDVAWTITLKLIARLAAAGMIHGVRGYHAVKKIRPNSFARFHMTNRCQLECIHCYTNSGPNVSSEGELTPERWIALVDAFADNGGEKILFTGGEALVFRGCIDVMRRAKERDLEVTLFSNGILIKRYLEDLKQVADIVQISLDGPDETSHDAVRGRGSFKKAIEAIKLLLDAGFETRISTTIMMNNWPAIRDGFPRLIEQFEETPLTFRVSYGTMSHGRGELLEHGLNEAEVRRYVDRLLSRVKTTEDRDTGVNVVQKIIGCGYAEQLVVAPNGGVYPCHLMSGLLGHIDQMPIQDITDYLKRTAEAFSVRHRKGCGTCDLRNLCGGSCRVEDEKTTGSRLITTCSNDDKLRKKRFLVRRYDPRRAG